LQDDYRQLIKNGTSAEEMIWEFNSRIEWRNDGRGLVRENEYGNGRGGASPGCCKP